MKGGLNVDKMSTIVYVSHVDLLINSIYTIGEMEFLYGVVYLCKKIKVAIQNSARIFFKI